MKKSASATPDTTLSLAQRLTETIRNEVIAGALKPGQRLSEAALSARFDVSRNSLREAFRLLTVEGLLRHEPNRGVFVATPSISSIIDIYRLRRLIECRALEQAPPRHPAITQMRAAVDYAMACRAVGDWQGAGSANMAFHAAIVDLADSPRLNSFFGQVAAELRLCFSLFNDAEFLHAPYVERNIELLALLEAGQRQEAARALETYLNTAERTLLAAFARLDAAKA